MPTSAGCGRFGQALLRAWQGRQGAEGGPGAAAAAEPARNAAGDDLLFFVSTEGDKTAAAAPDYSEAESGSDDGGLDLNALPDDPGSSASDSGDTSG